MADTQAYNGEQALADLAGVLRDKKRTLWKCWCAEMLASAPLSLASCREMAAYLNIVLSQSAENLTGNTTGHHQSSSGETIDRIWVSRSSSWNLAERYHALELLQRCCKQVIRSHFASIETTTEVHVRAHESLEDAFAKIIEAAIEFHLKRDAAAATEANQKVQQALRAHQAIEERLRVATSAAGVGIFEWSGASRTAVWENSRMYEITGQPVERGPLSADEFLSSVVHPDDVASLQVRFRASMAIREPVKCCYRLFRVADQALRTVEMYGYFLPDRDRDNYCFIGSLIDVTERANAEQALKDADRRKDVFLATLAHELRNPLAPVRNAAHVLASSAGDDLARRGQLCGMIERQTKHLAHLIDDLLDVSRITTGKIKLRWEAFDVRDAVNHALEMAMPAADQRGHKLVVHVPKEPLIVRGDRGRIAQVLGNLLDNAIKYTDEGGLITLRVAPVDGQVSILISDTGIGIAGELLAHVFDLFVQASEHGEQDRGGLGIGLSVSRTLADMHGGTLEARSAGRGKGSEFELRLPPASEQSGGATLENPQAIQRFGPASILIVDDNVDALQSLAIVLSDRIVHTAASGEQALEIAADIDPDVVILDLGLPGISGYEVARRLRARQSPQQELVIIALSGYGQPEDMARSREAGCDVHLVKPVDIPALMDAIHFSRGRL